MDKSVTDQIKEDYKNLLNQVIENDPVVGPLYREREELKQQIAPSLSRISDITNTINNINSKEIQNALKALRALR